MCLLVIIGVTDQEHKELVAVEDGYRESEVSWSEVLTGFRLRGLETSPKLAVGDGALGFWNAMAKSYPGTKHQRCWIHEATNVLAAVPQISTRQIARGFERDLDGRNQSRCLACFQTNCGSVR